MVATQDMMGDRFCWVLGPTTCHKERGLAVEIESVSQERAVSRRGRVGATAANSSLLRYPFFIQETATRSNTTKQGRRTRLKADLGLGAIQPCMHV